MRYRSSRPLAIPESDIPPYNSLSANVTTQSERGNEERPSPRLLVVSPAKTAILIVRDTLQPPTPDEELQLAFQERPTAACNLNKPRMDAKVSSLLRT